jgi:hypothetical protein
MFLAEKRKSLSSMTHGQIPHVNVVTIVAWAGVGKSTLVNHWLGQMAAEDYRSAQLAFGWSFYRQGTSGDTSSADEFLMRLSTGLEIQTHGLEQPGRRARDSRSSSPIVEACWVLDGLEPLQNPPGP